MFKRLKRKSAVYNQDKTFILIPGKNFKKFNKNYFMQKFFELFSSSTTLK